MKRRLMGKAGGSALGCALLLFAVAMPGIAMTTFSFTKIDYPGARETQPGGINDGGQIVGSYFDGTRWHGFLLSAGVYRTIDVQGSCYTYLFGINDRGQIAGSFDDGTSWYEYDGGPSCWTERFFGFVADIPFAGNTSLTPVVVEPGCPEYGSGALDINDSGQILGVCDEVGFVYSNGSFTSLQMPGKGPVQALGINDAGQFVGSTLSGDDPIIGDGGQYTTLGLPGPAIGINDRGQIVGDCYLFSGGKVSTFAFPGANATHPQGINDSGQIVGYYENRAGAHGFLAVPTSVATLTVSKAGNGRGAVTSAPSGIDCGPLCASHVASYAPRTSVRLSAVPEPGAVFMGWSGACQGLGACTVSQSGNKTVGATFSLIPGTVCPTGCAAGSVQAAIDAAGSGDVVRIAPGTYTENLVIGPGKDITLRGAAPGVVFKSRDAPEQGSVVSVVASAVGSVRLGLEDVSITGGFAQDGGGVRAVAEGGGGVQLSLTNVVLHHNVAVGGGGGLLAKATGVDSAVALDIVNTTIADNAASRGGGAILMASESGSVIARAFNDILWGNRATSLPAESDISLQEAAPGTVRLFAGYSDIGIPPAGGGTYQSGPNLTKTDPIFQNPAKNDYRIHRDSPLVNTGAAVWSPPLGGEMSAPDHDFESEGRPAGIAEDQGADEYRPEDALVLGLQSPLGGEVLQGGRPFNINWNAPSSMTRFKVSISSNKGGVWRPLSRRALRAHHKTWTPPVPFQARKTWRVMVEAFDSKGVLKKRAVSRLFTIVK